MSVTNNTPFTLWYNPSCSKSRKALSLLEDSGHTPELLHYLDSPPTREALVHVLSVLGGGPRALMRKGERPYTELGLDDAGLSDAALIDAMIAHPILIQRPVLVQGERAVVARPPELVLSLVD